MHQKMIKKNPTTLQLKSIHLRVFLQLMSRLGNKSRRGRGFSAGGGRVDTHEDSYWRNEGEKDLPAGRRDIGMALLA